MISIYAVLVIVVVHWFADFVMQDGEWAVNKSKDFKALLKHTSTYSAIWYFVLVIVSVWGNHFGGPTAKDLGWSPWMLLFPVVTFITHTITDYFTSKHTSKQYAKGNFGTSIPRGMDFFVTIGFDQTLHFAQLFLTYYLFTI